MRILLSFVMFTYAIIMSGQNGIVEGYAFEEDNRGYLGMALVKAADFETKQVFDSTFSNAEGYFKMNVPANLKLVLTVQKDMFETLTDTLDASGAKHFVNAKMKRLPGYVFEITMAEKRDNQSHVANALKDMRIEAYNNTTKDMVLDIANHPFPEFRLNMLKGNHYTILIRKDGYLAKRMEAFVNINGCILCFEGIGDVKPGVTDNLSGSNSIGMLLANVELDKISIGKLFGISNIYYASGSADLNETALKELDKVALMAKDNPNIIFELGSHTDHIGNNTSNLALSEKRADEVVKYLVNKKDVRKNQLIAKGYGESKSINNCTDENPCSTSELAKNRRTELKILGTSDDVRQMSLKELKNIEEFEKSLQVSVLQNTKNTIPKIEDEVADINTSEAIVETVSDTDETANMDIGQEIKLKELKSKVKSVFENSHGTANKKFLIQAGTFKEENRAIHLLDKLLLLGYSDSYIYKEKAEFVLLVEQTSDASYALKVIDDLIKNGINARIVEY